MKELDESVLRALSSLRYNKDFEVFLEWLRANIADLMKSNSSMKDDILIRWQQGGIQVLVQLLEAIDSVETSLEMLKNHKDRKFEHV